MVHDARVKRYIASERELVNILRAQFIQCDFFCFNLGQEIPEDAKIVGTYYDHSRMAFVFTLYHPSFPVVPDGEVVPLINRADKCILACSMDGVIEHWIARESEPGGLSAEERASLVKLGLAKAKKRIDHAKKRKPAV